MEHRRQANKLLDGRGWSCAWCILKSKSLLKLMKPGEILEVLCTDPETVIDLPKILKQSSDQLIWVDEQSDFFRLHLRRGHMENSSSGKTTAFQGVVEGKPAKKEVTMTTVDLNSIEAASVVDARGSACPGPLLEAKKGIGKVRVGEVLEILSNDSATKGDIPVWAKKVGHEYLGHIEADGYDRIFVVRQK